MSRTGNRPGAVIFDMDGLMLDTERIYRDVWQQVSRELGYPIDGPLWSRLVGRNNRDCERALVRAFGPRFPLERFRAGWRERWLERVRREGVPVKPGLRRLLDALDSAAVAMAVATSTDRDLAEPSLEGAGLAGRFACVVTGDEIERGKPAPDIFLAAAERLGVPPARCVVLEDSNAGVEAAAAAAMRTIMVPDTEPPSARATALADQVVSSLWQARDVLLHE